MESHKIPWFQSTNQYPIIINKYIYIPLYIIYSIYPYKTLQYISHYIYPYKSHYNIYIYIQSTIFRFPYKSLFLLVNSSILLQFPQRFPQRLSSLNLSSEAMAQATRSADGNGAARGAFHGKQWTMERQGDTRWRQYGYNGIIWIYIVIIWIYIIYIGIKWDNMVIHWDKMMG